MDLGEDCDEGAGLELVSNVGDFAEAARLTKRADEALALGLSSAKAGPLGEHDRPGEDARDKQDDEDCERHRAAVVDHLHQGTAVGPLWVARLWGLPGGSTEQGRGCRA